MPSGKRTPTIESKALSIAIKRAMAVRDIKTPALAKESGVPYGTLRRILELNSVADYEQLRKISDALRMQLSEIVSDAENLAEDPDVIADYREETGDTAAGERDASGIPSDFDSWSKADQAAYIGANPDKFDLAAHRGNTKLEQESYEQLP